MNYQHLTLEEFVVGQLVEFEFLKLAASADQTFPAAYAVPQQTVLAAAAPVVRKYFATVRFDFENPASDSPQGYYKYHF